MEITYSVNCLKRSEWTSPVDVKKQKKENQNDYSKNNLINLITSCITDSFPELVNCSDIKFIKFQNSLKKIIDSQIG